MEVALHYTGKHQKQNLSESQEELALPKRFSGDSADELAPARHASKRERPVKAATASPDGDVFRRCTLAFVCMLPGMCRPSELPARCVLHRI